MTKKKVGTTLFGWCLDGHHKECRKSIYLSMQDEMKECGCECHREEEK